jgi:GNAT superfamily N-acetyltransferase
MTDKPKIHITNGGPEHYQNIVDLYRSFRGDDWMSIRLEPSLAMFPSAVVYDGEKMIGFAYTFSFAPDFYELNNIYVDASYQNQKLGARLLESIEARAKDKGIKGFILTNSFLNQSEGQKKSPENFYLRHGYKIVADTGHTKVFIKQFT